MEIKDMDNFTGRAYCASNADDSYFYTTLKEAMTKFGELNPFAWRELEKCDCDRGAIASDILIRSEGK